MTTPYKPKIFFTSIWITPTYHYCNIIKTISVPLYKSNDIFI